MTTTKSMKEMVREGYGNIAKQKSGGCGCGCGDNSQADDVASRIGYDAAELATLPAGANLGLSCGNPTAVAALKEGETVVDLGSGAGFDAFLCAPRVGKAGKVIGVDMTAEMIDKANGNNRDFAERTNLNNVEFRLGEIEHMPLADAEADVVISNCVINLSPDKPQVWREMSRVLKPGGRVSVSDISLLKPLPGELADKVAAIVGCVGGAIPVADTLRYAEEAGLTDITAEAKEGYVAAMEEWKDPLYQGIIDSLPEGENLANYIASVTFTARKPE